MIDTYAYKTRLLAELEELTKELKTIGVHNPNNPSDWIAIPDGVDANEPDTDAVADVTEEWDTRASLVAELEMRYNDITRALQKIEDATYGFCEVCGEPIEQDRLDANPSARTDKAHIHDGDTLAT